MKKIMQWIMLSCKKATELIEKEILTKLSFRQKVQLKMHKSLCDACTAYEKQSKFMDEFLNKHIHNEENEIDNPEVVKNIDLKNRILKNLSK